MKKIMVFGTFDILHRGHIHFFNQARKHGDYLIAVVARDKTVLKVKGRLPHHTEKERHSHVKKYVDKAVLGYIRDKYKIIKQFRPELIALGYDQDADLDVLKKLGIQIIRLSSYKPHLYKSSKIRKNISS